MTDNSEMGQYLVRISKRIASLEVNSNELKERMFQKSDDIHESGKKFNNEIQNIKTNLKEINMEISELSKDMTSLMNTFKRIARKEHLDRLQRRIDDWAPEKLATKKDLEKAFR